MTDEELAAAEQANAESYAAEIALITAATAVFVLAFAKYFLGPAMTAAQWINALGMLYPEIERRREQAASAARKHYDTQRDLYAPSLPTMAQDLEPYRFEWFVQAMEPVRKRMVAENTPPQVAADTALYAVREVEIAARRQIIHAIESDGIVDEYLAAPPEERAKVTAPASVVGELQAALEEESAPTPGPTPRPRLRSVKTSLDVKGWARVATGDETCAWCLMLVSRGPVYMSAESAGLSDRMTETRYVRMYNEQDLDSYGEKIVEEGLMDKWHKGCDCIVVPVFNKKTWFGKDAAKNALDLWDDATKAAEAELKKNPDKTYYSYTGPRYRGDGDKNPGWYKTTLNREAINQLRARINAGSITPQEWAALSAAV